MDRNDDILNKAWKAAMHGGIPGMTAMGAQVTTLMWLRTTMNYQYKYGSTISNAITTIYSQGGIRRFYSGYTLAMIQGPLARFGDTAANMGMLSLIDSYDETKKIPIAVKTVAASSTAAMFRIGLMPLDTMKTAMQVEGKKGWTLIHQKIKLGGPRILFHGSTAAAMATFVGHYPWYTTFNYLNATIPEYHDLKSKLVRNAFIGLCASIVSDSVSNSLRVIKTVRQTSQESKGYNVILKEIMDKEGIAGLFGRGLKMRLITNCTQGVMFSVLWKLGQEYY